MAGHGERPFAAVAAVAVVLCFFGDETLFVLPGTTGFARSQATALRGSGRAVLDPSSAAVPRGVGNGAAEDVGDTFGTPLVFAAATLCGLLAAGGARRHRKDGRHLSARRATEQHTHVNSDRIFLEAKDLMPGGVSSPVRAFASVGGNPVIVDRVKGAYMYDVDGNQYIDLIGSWGPAIVGHADDDVLDALSTQLAKGTSFGAPCALENELAKEVIAAVPSIEMVRFTNSGTEACMGMLRVARAYTGREKIIKFEGCYHGHADPFLVKAGSAVATLGLPDSPGVPAGATATTLVAQYNDLSSVEALLKDHDVAAIVLEPVVGNSGFIAPSKEFLEGLRQLTKQHGALLVFDEVMTGFRISYGGAQKYFGVTPDITTLGKVIGGGLPVGAYGGRRDIMEMIAPAGPVYQAGTLSGNPLAMVAGLATLKKLRAPGAYEHLHRITHRLVEGLLAAGRDAGHDVCGGSISGMFGLFFTKGPVRCFADAAKSDADKFGKFHRLMLDRGVYFAPSQFEAGFTSLAHTEADVDRVLTVAKEAFSLLPS